VRTLNINRGRDRPRVSMSAVTNIISIRIAAPNGAGIKSLLRD